ncbi:hypothetical protein ONS95_000489 [Cadophora gregata]|uniref:uncharacterized protein n=1 Tax=Cadophora gregata TaxID=51156 RepID=UPI0026DDB03E|nr:uncharacterized protein ONS95_000489 [Cadophora gregata]KAK0128521.1 hypothetical protein ONS95_000489 [Cadophora gregata]
MDYSLFDYAGNPWNGATNNEVLTPNFFNGSDYDFSNMLNFTPPAGTSQNAMLNMAGNLQPTSSNMPGDYVGGSEYPFPNLPTSAYLPTSAAVSTVAPANTMVPADTLAPTALAITSQNNNPMSMLPPADGGQQGNSQVQERSSKPSLEDTNTQSSGQKRASSSVPSANPDVAPEPKPKRRRGARKKVRTAEELAIKRENHLQRNRDAAQKCRQKKKLTEAEKKDQMIKERQDNHFVWSQVAILEEELDAFQTFASDVDSRCNSDEHKGQARTSMDKIVMLSAKLQEQIDMCNQRRADVGQGFVMTRSYGGYVQQDSLQDGPESLQDGQSPAMSPQNSTYLPGHGRSNSYATSSVGDQPTGGSRSRPMTGDISQSGNRINTDFANSVNMSRNGSSGSIMQADSAIDFNSPAGGAKKDMSIEDDGIGNPKYRRDEPLPSLETTNADLSFTFLSQLELGGPDLAS